MAGVGVSDDDLNEVAEAAKALPFVEVRRSTGGSGHRMSTSMASQQPTTPSTPPWLKAVLGMTGSSETGFDFGSNT